MEESLVHQPLILISLSKVNEALSFPKCPVVLPFAASVSFSLYTDSFRKVSHCSWLTMRVRCGSTSIVAFPCNLFFGSCRYAYGVGISESRTNRLMLSGSSTTVNGFGTVIVDNSLNVIMSGAGSRSEASHSMSSCFFTSSCAIAGKMTRKLHHVSSVRTPGPK